MPNQFAFVLADNSGKPKKSDRVLIRSHCMQGKNKGKPGRRSSQKHSNHVTPATPDQDASEQRQVVQEQSYLWSVPRSVSELQSLLHGAEVDTFSKQMMFNWLNWGASENLYPVAKCLDFQRMDDYARWMAEDASFLHCTLLSACATNDLIMQQPLSRTTSLHLRNTLSSLNACLSKGKGSVLDSVMITVITLAIVSGIFEDYDATATHMRGLHRIVQLRGGDEYLHRIPKVYFKINRIDLSWCLNSGETPFFQPALPSWEPFFQGPIPTSLHPIREQISIDGLVDSKLAACYRDLQHLANLINEKETTNTLLNTTIYQEATHSIQSRLLQLQQTFKDDISECLCLGMLAILTTTFKLPGRTVPYKRLARRLYKALSVLSQKDILIQEFRDFILWVLIASILSISDFVTPIVHSIWKAVVPDELTWSQAESILKGIIWIDFIHDELGEKVFWHIQQGNSILSSRRHGGGGYEESEDAIGETEASDGDETATYTGNVFMSDLASAMFPDLSK